jgi:thioredoxin reductase (NADPH)
VYVVGAANSAGQAVLNLARYARKVVLLVRGERLEDSMSHYLVARIREAANVEVRLQTQVVGGGGDGHLERLQLCDEASGSTEEVATSWLFVFIGAAPRTDWLGAELARDDRGFLVTGSELLTTELTGGGGVRWPLERPPYILETSVPGVFAAGDVRLDSMKRVASAVGEGAMAVHLVHRYLATI